MKKKHNWYNDHVGQKKCPVVDTWWQTETGIMISPIAFVTPTKPTYATLPLPGIQPVLMDENRNEIEGNQVGKFVLNFHGLGLLEQFGVTIRGIGYLFFSLSRNLFHRRRFLRDEVGYYRITGRVDDVVIVSGHNLGTVLLRMPSMSIPQLPKVLLLVFRMTSKGTHFMVM
jgi:acetyl-CoA synthetase